MIKRKDLDCCCSDWKNIVKELWNRCQEAVKGIKAGPKTYYPDGQGIVNMPGLLSDIELFDMGSYWNMVVDAEISTISLNEQTGYWTLEVE